MIKKAIRKWLVPEYGETLLRLESFLNEIEEARKAVSAEGKDIEINGPVVFLGSLKDCNVKLIPNIKPTIILSQFDMDSMLHFTGSYSTISNNIIAGMDKDVGLNIETQAAEGE